MARLARTWTEDEAAEPIDLRMAVIAVAVWSGCLIGLWATDAAGWVLIITAVALGAVIPAALRRRRTAGLIAALVCFAAATVASTVQMRAAQSDPLVAAAARGDWALIEVVLDEAPVPVATRFGPPIDGEARHGASAGDPGDTGRARRWRLHGRAVTATISATRTRTGAPVTIFAQGRAWSTVTAGATIRVRGVTSTDVFGVLPGVVVQASGPTSVSRGPPRITAWARAARSSLIASAAVLDADPGGLLRGLVVGDTRGVGGDLSDDAKTTGLTHLLAVSGTHMAIVSGAVLLLLRRWGPRWSAAGVLIALGGMVMLVGPAPSVLRAAVMGLIGVLAMVSGRSRSALPALSATVFVLLLADPSLAVTVGFVLSVQATAGLILLVPPLTRALERRGVPRGWASLVALPVAAHLATMPVIAAISGQVSLVAIPANIAVTPVVAPALLIGLLCLLVGPWWPTGGQAVARVDGPLLQWIASVAHHLARWPAATVPWPASPAGVVALAALTVGGLAVLRYRRARIGAAALIVGVAVVLVPAHVVGVGWPVTGWLLTACDVGQGDGMVLSTGIPGTAVVVDTGPEPDAMDGCLTRLGVHRIGLLVLTHLHADHVGGLAGAARGRRIDAIGVGPDRSNAGAFAQIRRLAAERHIPVSTMTPGEHWSVGDLAVTVLGPSHPFVGTESDPNNDSVVLRATRRGIRMLMTGDIERPAQRSLLRRGVDLRAEVLKQPHHGSSKLLPEFLAAVSPTVAVIGVGADNDYGHPAPAALAKDRAAGVDTIVRTDLDGDVAVCWTPSGLATAIRGPP